jgi:hypothetical protein
MISGSPRPRRGPSTRALRTMTRTCTATTSTTRSWCRRQSPGCQQLELFVYLADVPEALGLPHLVSRTRTADLPVIANWYPRADGADPEHGFVSTAGRPDLYAAEQSAAGPAGTVVAFSPATVHRGTSLTAPAAPVTPCIWATGPHERNGANARHGPVAATTRPGTSSSAKPPHDSSSSSGSLLPATHS